MRKELSEVKDPEPGRFPKRSDVDDEPTTGNVATAHHPDLVAVFLVFDRKIKPAIAIVPAFTPKARARARVCGHDRARIGLGPSANGAVR